MRPKTDTISIRGLKIAFHTWGAPSDPPLLCFHGFMDHGQAFQPMVEHLKKPRYVVAIDFRGHGHSEWVGDGGDYRFDDYFHDVRMLVEHLGWERFDILGHSMGGSVAVGIAAILKENIGKVILLEGMGPPFHEPPERVQRIFRWSHVVGQPALNAPREVRSQNRKSMSSLEDASERLCRVNPRLPRDTARRLAETCTEPAPGGKGRVWRYDPLHRAPSPKPYTFEEAAEYWRSISAPVLSVWGTESPFRPDRLDERHAILSSVRIAHLPETSHNLHHERPELIAQTVEAWLDDGPLPPELKT